MTTNADLKLAFQILERYEEYRIKKTWGVMLVIFGFAIFLIYVIPWPLGLYLHIIVEIFAILYVIDRYLALRRVIREEEDLSIKYDVRFGTALFIISLFSNYIFQRLLIEFPFIIGIREDEFPVLYFLPEFVYNFLPLSIHLFFSAFAFISSYLLLRERYPDSFRELLITGLLWTLGGFIISIFIAIIRYFGSLYPLLYLGFYFLIIVNLGLFVGGYLICGIYQWYNAIKMLKDDGNL
ncbi:MAG: hypothetical protein ACFFC7_07030 [Candidatus Hermodarchaeota archaeon]